MLSFKKFLIKEEKTVFFSLLEMNPPSIAHQNIIEGTSVKAGVNPAKIYVTPSSENTSDPLCFSEKVKYARKMFPKYGRNIHMNENVRSIKDCAVLLFNESYKQITFVTEKHRRLESKTILEKYNGVKGHHGFYNFQKINIVAVESANLMQKENEIRDLVEAGNFTQFSQHLTETINTNEARKIFNNIRHGMGLKEVTSFKNHIEIESVSTTREKYVAGTLFEQGDQVVDKETEEIGTITTLGSNYIVMETIDGVRRRKWLDAVEKLNE